MALASLVSFQEQKQKHKSDYELAKARIFLRARADDNKSSFLKIKLWKKQKRNQRGNKRIFFAPLVDTR